MWMYSFGTRWPMYKLIENIAGRDIVLGTEYADEMASHSVFAHGIQVEPVASNLKAAGNLVRFVENNQSDIFQQHDLFRGVKDRNSDTAGIKWMADGEKYEQCTADFFMSRYFRTSSLHSIRLCSIQAMSRRCLVKIMKL